MPALTLQFSPQKLRDVRERSGYSRPGLAAHLKEEGHPVSAQHIGRLENGTSVPRPKTLRALRLGLGVELDALLDTETQSA